MKEKLVLRSGIATIMIFAVAMSRMLPHPPNFTPVGAMALFGAAYFSRKYLAFLIPLLAMWMSDLLLNNLVYAKMYPEFYQGFHLVWKYLGLPEYRCHRRDGHADAEKGKNHQSVPGQSNGLRVVFPGYQFRRSADPARFATELCRGNDELYRRHSLLPEYAFGRPVFCRFTLWQF